MGRKRAAFAEGIAEEEQRTPRCSGRSATCGVRRSRRSGGWSAGASRRCPGSRPPPSVRTRPPTGATARWRQPRSCASGQWRPTRPCRPHQNDTPRQSGCRPKSGTAAPWTVLASTSSSRPHIPAIRWCGCSVTRPSHCRCGRSQHRASSGRTSRRRLGRSTSRSRHPMYAAGTTGRVRPRGERDFERRLEDWDRQLREIHAGKRAHLDTWNQLTYDLASMTRDDIGRLRLDCKLGTYFHSLSTSEALDPELMEAYAAWPDSDPATVWPRLERRAWLHERVADPVADGHRRSAALGVSTLTIVRVRPNLPDPSTARGQPRGDEQRCGQHDRPGAGPQPRAERPAHRGRHRRPGQDHQERGEQQVAHQPQLKVSVASREPPTRTTATAMPSQRPGRSASQRGGPGPAPGSRPASPPGPPPSAAAG